MANRNRRNDRGPFQRRSAKAPLLKPKTVGMIFKERDLVASQIGVEILKQLRLKAPQIKVVLEKTARIPRSSLKRASAETILSKVEIAIVIGGDGTILRCTRTLLERNYWSRCSMIGVNAGKVGFLTMLTGKQAAKRLPPLLMKPDLFVKEDRSCLQVTIRRSGKDHRVLHVLNDCVLSKGSLSRLFEFHVDINQEYVSSYRADGMIISPPTGSTAYNLAAGGAILQPNIPAIQLTPISPQYFSNKPIVLSDENEIRIRLGRHSSDVYLTFDGQQGLKVEDHDELIIKRSPRKVRFLVPRQEAKTHYFHSLRQKLNWGLVERRAT